MNELFFQPLRYVILAALFLFLYRVVRAVDEDLGQAARADSAVAALVVEEAPPGMRRGQLLLVRSGAVVGRDASSHVVVPDPEVQDQHLRLVVRGQDFWVEQLGSGTACWLNGRKLEVPVPLRDGDRIQVGTTVLRFVVPSGKVRC